MSRPFRLRTVERLRQLKLEGLGRDLAVAQSACTTTQQRRDALSESLHRAVTPTSSTPDDVRWAADHRVAVRERIEALDLELVDLHGRLELARGQWLAARADLRAVESLHAAHRRAEQAERDRQEQRQADELAGSRSNLVRLSSMTQHDQPEWGPQGDDAA